MRFGRVTQWAAILAFLPTWYAGMVLRLELERHGRSLSADPHIRQNADVLFQQAVAESLFVALIALSFHFFALYATRNRWRDMRGLLWAFSSAVAGAGASLAVSLLVATFPPSGKPSNTVALSACIVIVISVVTWSSYSLLVRQVRKSRQP